LKPYCASKAHAEYDGAVDPSEEAATGIAPSALSPGHSGDQDAREIKASARLNPVSGWHGRSTSADCRESVAVDVQLPDATHYCGEENLAARRRHHAKRFGLLAMILI